MTPIDSDDWKALKICRVPATGGMHRARWHQLMSRSYILEIHYNDGWRRFFVDCAWPTRRQAKAYCKAHLSANDWPSRARVMPSTLPVSLPESVLAWHAERS